MTYTRNEVILKAEGVCVSYDRPILVDVNFEVRNVVRPGVTQGQVVSLVGKSGIGKSQLFRCLAGLQKPTGGRVLIDADQHEVRAGEVGVVPQNYVLFRHRTVEQNLRMAMDQSSATLHQVGRVFHADEVIIEHALQFHLYEHLKKYPHQLSGGQRQRVSILQQLLAGNRTVLLDEPFSGLDAPMIEKVLDLLRKVSLMDELNTLVIVSHDIESALAISDTAFVLAPCPPVQVDLPGNVLHRDGATIVQEIDLAARGLAFTPGIRDVPAFRDTVREVKASL